MIANDVWVIMQFIKVSNIWFQRQLAVSTQNVHVEALQSDIESTKLNVNFVSSRVKIVGMKTSFPNLE